MLIPVETERRGAMPRRYRRILWTVSTFGVLLLIGALVAWRIHKEREPEEYTPGEASSDITSGISEQQAARKVAAADLTPRVEVRSRRIDALRDPGRKLPAGAPRPLFTDVTEEAGLASFRQLDGARTSQLPEDMGSGLAWGDFDNDGWLDLFAVNGLRSADK